MAKLGGGIHKLELDLLQGSAAGLGQQAAAQSDGALLGACRVMYTSTTQGDQQSAGSTIQQGSNPKRAVIKNLLHAVGKAVTETTIHDINCPLTELTHSQPG
jgi:hypothetical protein